MSISRPVICVAGPYSQGDPAENVGAAGPPSARTRRQAWHRPPGVEIRDEEADRD